MDIFDSVLYYHNISSEICEGVVLVLIAEGSQAQGFCFKMNHGTSPDAPGRLRCDTFNNALWEFSSRMGCNQNDKLIWFIYKYANPCSD